MTQETNWLPGLIVLAVTCLAAAAFLFINRFKVTASPEARDGALDDLERRAQLLIEQLRELEAEKHHLEPARYAAEKSRLELEAAAALRAKDEYRQRKSTTKAGPRGDAPAPTGFSAKHPQLAGALWGAGIVLFFGTLGYLLVSEQRDREEGGTATGKVPPGMASQQQAAIETQEERELADARQRLANNPADLDAASLVAHVLIQRQDFEEAQRVTDRSLAIDPFHIESRVHKGVLRAVRGDVQGAEQELARLVDTWPDAQEALLVLGSMALQANNQGKALEYFERFAAETPRQMQPPQLLAAIRQLRQQLGVK
ncbi:tetratricopeptide repeat protein [Myxococcaceae bacterium GXIMD 01537]